MVISREAAPEWGGVWVGLLGFTTVCLFFASLMAIDLMRNLNDFHDTPVASGMVRRLLQHVRRLSSPDGRGARSGDAHPP